MVKIAAVQMNIEPLNPSSNIGRAFKLLTNAFKQEPDIICFPELFITGPVGEAISRFAQPIPGEYTNIFSRLASEYHAYIIVGSIIEKENNKYYNTSVLLSPEGDILGKYQKIFLWRPEKGVFERGKKLPVFKTKFGTVAIEICWDLALPEITRQFALKGADIVFCPSFWSEGDNPEYKEFRFSTESIFIDSCVSARAIENELAFVFVNGTGPWRLNGYIDKLVGRSQVALPFYGAISKLTTDEENVLIEEIDLSICKKARKIYSIIDDLKSLKVSGLEGLM